MYYNIDIVCVMSRENQAGGANNNFEKNDLKRENGTVIRNHVFL